MARCKQDFHPHLALNGVMFHHDGTQFVHDVLAKIEASIWVGEMNHHHQFKFNRTKEEEEKKPIQLIHITPSN